MRCTTRYGGNWSTSPESPPELTATQGPFCVPTPAGSCSPKPLHVHHTAEDDALWPALRETLAQRPDELALLAAMEAEHAAIDEVIQAIETALTDPGSGLDRLADLADSLVIGLNGHLKHEEDQALPLIQAFAAPQQWAHFGQVHGQGIGPDAPRLIPWLLECASERTVTTILSPLPELARAAYGTQWQPAYAALDRWSPNTAA